MTLTYVDSGVLIAAARGSGPPYVAAMAILADPARSFASSDFVRLEVVPKATYNKRPAELNFYTVFFSAVQIWVPTTDALVRHALALGSQFGLGGMDALHVAAAQLAAADEFVTSEQPT